MVVRLHQWCGQTPTPTKDKLVVVLVVLEIYGPKKFGKSEDRNDRISIHDQPKQAARLKKVFFFFFKVSNFFNRIFFTLEIWSELTLFIKLAKMKSDREYTVCIL